MNLLLAFILSFLAVIGYSLISIFIGKISQKHGAFWTGFWIQILGLPITLLFVPFFGLSLAVNQYLLPILIFGIGISFNFILYARVLAIGPPSIVQAILRIGSLITFILALVFLGESVSFLKVSGALIIVSGAILASLDFKELHRKKVRLLTKAVPLATLEALISGIIFVFLGIGIKHFGGFSANVGVRLFVVPIYLLISQFRPKPKTNMLKVSWKMILFIAAVDAIAFILYALAIQIYEVSFASIMLATMPIVTAIISALFFHEKLSSQQKLGIILTVIGAISLTLRW